MLISNIYHNVINYVESEQEVKKINFIQNYRKL